VSLGAKLNNLTSLLRVMGHAFDLHGLIVVVFPRSLAKQKIHARPLYIRCQKISGREGGRFEDVTAAACFLLSTQKRVFCHQSLAKCPLFVLTAKQSLV